MKSKLKGINGWIIIILILFAFSALNAFYLIVQRLIWIFTQQIEWGVKVSLFLLITYFTLICFSLYFILEKKKKAVKMSIISLVFGAVFALWYYVIGRLIFLYGKTMIISGIFSFIINLAIIILVIFYFKKSKRVKNTLIK